MEKVKKKTGELNMKIVLTGGGTAGHVVPNLALIPELKQAGFDVDYIGSKDGIERELAERAGLPFYGISSGKLRRYLSLKNFSDALKVVKGVNDARKALKKIKPDIIFSKGGFVAVPVVFAAKMLKIPVVIHESDITVGLANKLAIPRSQKVCYVFPETIAQLPKEKAMHTGTPIRKEILNGSAIAGDTLCQFMHDKPVIMVMGGSLGSAFINSVLREALPDLTPNFNIIHICGKGNFIESLQSASYRQFEYVQNGMGDLLAFSKLVVSRAGANSLAEISALKKPNILIPLPKAVSRGDQILNAQSFEKQGFSVVLQEENITPTNFVEAINETFKNRGAYSDALRKAAVTQDASSQIVKIILETMRS